MIAIESFHQPKILKQALSLLAKLPNPKVLAGGTDLLAQLHRDSHLEHLRRRPPKSWMAKPVQLVDISRLEDLQQIWFENGKCRIGALMLHSELARQSQLIKQVSFLCEAAGRIGSPQIRNRGTIGGNIANASPCADTVPPLTCLHAEVVLQSANGIRRLPVEKVATASQQTILNQDELLTEIIFALPTSNSIQFFRKLGQRRGVAIAKLSVAFLAHRQADRLSAMRIALGAVGPTVLLAEKTADFLTRKPLTRELLAAAKSICSGEAMPIDDLRSTRVYRAAMVGELLEMGLQPFLPA